MTDSKGPGFGDGLRVSLPIVIGYLPIAFSFGVAATTAGLTPLEAVFLSLVIYAGASQFVALALITGGAAVPVAIVTLLAMNIRHVFYGPAVLDLAGPEARRGKAWLWSFGLTDEVFGATVGFMARTPRRWSERFMIGLGLCAYAAWVLGTAAGAYAGSGVLSAYPALEAALGFMLPALFLALLLSILSRAQVPVIVVAGGVAVLVTLMSSVTTGILAGMVAGAVTGMLLPGPKTSEDAA